MTASWHSLGVKSQVRLWDPGHGDRIGKPIEFKGAVHCVCQAPTAKPSSREALTLECRTGEVRFWNRATGRADRGANAAGPRAGALGFQS